MLFSRSSDGVFSSASAPGEKLTLRGRQKREQASCKNEAGEGEHYGTFSRPVLKVRRAAFLSSSSSSLFISMAGHCRKTGRDDSSGDKWKTEVSGSSNPMPSLPLRPCHADSVRSRGVGQPKVSGTAGDMRRGQLFFLFEGICSCASGPVLLYASDTCTFLD